MYKVYWTESSEVQSQNFTDCGEALKFCEVKRKLQYAGEDINHIVMSAENPNNVGKLGVDVTGPDYDWKKRRK